MKTLKQIIAEAKDKRPYPTERGDALHIDHYDNEDESEAIRNAGPHPLVKKRMDRAFAGVEYERYIPDDRKAEKNPEKRVVEYRKKRVAKRKKKST